MLSEEQEAVAEDILPEASDDSDGQPVTADETGAVDEGAPVVDAAEEAGEAKTVDSDVAAEASSEELAESARAESES
jgi:hypothetical protein